LMCGCDKRGSRWVPDRCGGYYTNPSGAKPVENDGWGDYDPYWENDRR